MVQPISPISNFDEGGDDLSPLSPEGLGPSPIEPEPTQPEPITPGPDSQNPEWTDNQTPDPTVLDWAMMPHGQQVAAVDFDLDGLPDRILVDTNGDGAPDIVIERIDGGFREYYDGDLDGGFETVKEFTDAEMWAMDPDFYTFMTGETTAPTDGLPPVPDPGPEIYTEPEPDTDPFAPTVDGGTIIGDPFAYGDDWFYQAFNGSCVPAAVAQIFNEYTGQNVTDLEFVDIANQEGVWVVGPDGVPGLYPQDAARLLEAAGIPATHMDGQDINDLAEFLAPPPHAVMVAVDADVFWYGESADQINHAVLITGIDPHNGIVYLSDTGTPEGNMMEVSLDDFLEAWGVGNNQIVVADVSADEFRAQNGSAPHGDDQTGAPVEDGDIGATAGGVADWVRENKWVIVPAVLGADAVRR